MFIVFPCMVSDTSVLVYTAWRGIFQRDYSFGDLVRFRFAAVVTQLFRARDDN